MMFYDMITKLRDYEQVDNIDDVPFKMKNIIDSLPKEIIEIIESLGSGIFLDINSENSNSILDEIWKLTLDICEDYLEIDKIHSIGIEKKELLEDIKSHIIFTIFVSFKYRKTEMKFVEEFIREANQETTTKEMYDNAKESYYKSYDTKFETLKEDLYSNNINNRYSDFHYCINESIKVLITDNKMNKKDEYVIDFKDSKLLLSILDNWYSCPYNKNNSFGMLFNKLNEFGKALGERNKESNTTHANFCLKAYAIEKFFDLCFLHELSRVIINKYKEDENKEKTKKGKKKEKKDEARHAEVALALVELTSLLDTPMVFARHKYISMIYDKLLGFKEEQNIFIETSANTKANSERISSIKFYISYLNNFVFNLLQATYYYLFLLFETNNPLGNKGEIQADSIQNYFEEYIENNKSQYQYKDIIESLGNLDEHALPDELQINITRLVYDYTHNRLWINKEETIEEFIDRLKSATTIDFLNPKYNYINYYCKFPINTIYGDYIKPRIKMKSKFS